MTSNSSWPGSTRPSTPSLKPPCHSSRFFLPLAIATLFLSNAKAENNFRPAQRETISTSQIVHINGYELAEVTNLQQHPDIPQNDPVSGNVVKLTRTLPLIIKPMTPESAAYNFAMASFAAKWWQQSRIGGPSNNTVTADPDTDFTLDCEMVDLQPLVDGYAEHAGERMLPNVVSAACFIYAYTHGAAHGGGENFGFNWLLNKKRTIEAGDLFNLKSKWLTALTEAVHASGHYRPQDAQNLSFSDTNHWVQENYGLGLTYADNDIAGIEDGGQGMFTVVPWSTLAPYLRKDGVVPEKDWHYSSDASK